MVVLPQTADTRIAGASRKAGVSLFHLYGLRAVFLLIAVAMGAQIWPGILHHGKLGLMQGVARSLLAALTALSLLGVRYPLTMLPLMLFEFAWKSIWLLSIALPLWSANQMDADTWDTVTACLMGAILCPIVIPWQYVFETYIARRGDRWR